MRFRLLGDMQAAGAGGRSVDLGHVRQRCVLAVLLIEANHSVPTDQLIDRAWGDRIPQRARGTLHTYLSRLRQVLDAVPDVAIVRQHAGYLLAIDPAAVDLHRFQRLLGRARAADDESALALLDEALELWHGEPFATLDTPWLGAVRNDLGMQRRAAELDRNDIALRRGDHARILADLSVAAAAQPLDERLTGQLMLAQYRSGRQSDALDTYRQVRLRLADDLGTDPSPPLRRLYHRVLTADPELAAPTHRNARSNG